MNNSNLIFLLNQLNRMSEKDPKKDEKAETNQTEESVTTSEEKKEVSVPPNPVRVAQKRAFIASVLSSVFILVLALVFFDDQYLSLNIGATSAFQIASYWHKLEFVLCYQTLGIAWILFNMFYVISKRINSPTIIPTEEDTSELLVAKNIMQNSIEQFLMSAFAQIISISFIDKVILLKVIPLINILFVIGRVAFWLGYPKYRTFGFMCSAIPNTLLINYNLIKFIQNLFF